jgi:hypothetical protein
MGTDRVSCRNKFDSKRNLHFEIYMLRFKTPREQ